jgi:mono/diheme cytochrome c family protein
MRAKRLVIAAAVIGFLAAFWFVSFVRHGFSAHDEPTGIEKFIARTVRHWAVPSDLRSMKNPVPATPEVLAEASAHFADHCAGCHGNDGKGVSGLGQHMYPRTPDMTLRATQSLSDGELFSIIENGVRLTGMPGFGDGTAGSARGSWALVRFIRHMPELTPEEIAGMEKLNPRSAEEWQQIQNENSFLAGNAEATSSASTTQEHHH